MSIPLSYDDFVIEDGKLRLARRGNVAVLIYAKSPETEQFKKLLTVLNVERLQSAFLDISQGKNKQVILDSRKTTTPIKDVPYLGFFADGKLKARYKGVINKGKLEEFFNDKIVESAMAEKTTGTRKNDTVSSTMASQFSMSRTSGAGAKGPVSSSAGTIPYNQAWKKDIPNH